MARLSKKNKNRLEITQLVVSRNNISQTINITSRINAILGENGAGKTTLLSTIGHIVNSGTYPNSIYFGSHISLRHNNIHYNFPVKILADTSSKNIINLPFFEVVNSSQDAHNSINYLKNQKNLEEYLSQFENQKIDDNQLDEFRIVTGIRYLKIKILEFESPSNPDDFLPYFSVELSNGITYNSLGMGFGELCAFIVIWRIRRCQAGQAILLDEPDSHLSPNSRRRLVDFFAVKAAKKELYIIFSTHSVESIEIMKEQELLLLARPDGNDALPINIESDKRQAFLRLGLTLSRRFLIVVEDVDSHELVNQILQKFQPTIGKICEVVPLIKGGEQVAKFANDFPRNTSICHTIAILDGDKSNTIAPSENILFLPYDLDPIAAAKNWVETNISILALNLNLRLEQVQKATDASAHVDHHDYCSELANSISLPGIFTRDIRRALFGAWLSDAEVSLEFETFGIKIYNKITNSSIYRNKNTESYIN